MAKIKYIIDYKGYGNFFELTQTRTGEHTQITREEAKDYVYDNKYRAENNIVEDTFFSVRADVNLRSVPQMEVV
jgi:hypothetical protein